MKQYKTRLARTAMTLLLALFTSVTGAWANEVEIGNPESTNTQYTLPVNMLYNYSLTQQIYTADEIGMAGTITSIAFDYTYSSSFSMEGIQIYMMNVNKESFESNTDMVALGTATKVWEGTFTADGAGWVTIDLDTPFAYDGTSNLLLCCCDPTNSYPGGNFRFRTTAKEADLAIAYYSDDYVPNLQDVSTYSGSKYNYKYRNNIKLEITPAGGTICAKPDVITVSNITANSATITWEGEGSTWNLRYKASNDEDYSFVNGLTSQSYTFSSNLAGNTTYSVGVQTDCGSGSTSSFKSTTFTTANPCAAPTNLQITNVTTSSATLTWTPGYQETEWTVKYKKAAESWDDAIVETVNGTPTLALSNLASLTTYNVQVYNCENYVSANFTTAAGIPFTEAFGTTSAPTGWKRYNTLLTDDVLNGTTALTSYSGGWTFGTGNNVFDSHAKVNIYGTSNCKYWLVTPTLQMEDNVQLTFDMALTVWSSSSSDSPTPGNQDDDRFIVLITTDGGTTWSILREWNNSGSQYVFDEITNAATGQTVAIDLSNYANKSIAIAFYGESTKSGGDNNLHIDNVSIDYIPDCAKPTGVAASTVTAHEATITWTSDAAAWQVQLDEGEPIDVTEATYTFTNLDPETTYTAKVRTNCGGTYSDWSKEVSFTTTIACPAPTNLTVTPAVQSAIFTWESNADEWDVAYSTDATADPAELNVVTVNEATYTVEDLELGDYYFWVRANCGNVDGKSQWAGPAKVHIGYCVPNPSSRDGKGITKVEFGTDDVVVNNVDETNGLPASSPFYGDYSSMVGAMQAGVESNVSITYATGSSTVYSYGTIIWVDWDNSLSFEDDEIVYTGTSAQGSDGTPQVLEATFTVPATQATGDYRMRIAGADSYFDSYIRGEATANHSACFSSSYAVCHDYTLRVLAPPSCLMPTNLAINYTGGTTAEVTWEGGSDTYNISVNGTVTEGVTSPSYTLENLELASTYEVKVQAVCSETDQSDWSKTVSLTTDLCPPENMCEISYSFTDQYDDSWNGAYMNIVDATTGKLLYELTMPDVEGPYEGSFKVCDGREIQFVWVSGSYPRECGYTFFDLNGEVILEKATNSAAPDAGVVLTYTVDCTETTWRRPTNLTANANLNSVELSWTENSTTPATAWVVAYKTGDADFTEVSANSNPFILTGLTPETTYKVKVRPATDEVEKWSSEITFTTTDALILANDCEENGDVISANNNQVLSVKLQGRKLYRDGDWNTFCVPFNLTSEQIATLLTDADIRTLDNAEFDEDDGTLTLNFTEEGDITAITAGTPYIIKWSDGTNITDPVFTGVTIDATTHNVECDLGDGKSITFLGTYDYMSFTSENRSILFLGDNNTLYWPLSGATIGACRAYFKLKGLSAGDVSTTRLFFGEVEETTSLPQPLQREGSQAGAWYTLDGRKLDGKPAKKGVYINNGVKVVIK